MTHRRPPSPGATVDDDASVSFLSLIFPSPNHQRRLGQRVLDGLLQRYRTALGPGGGEGGLI
jgi:hypothetical protein